MRIYKRLLKAFGPQGWWPVRGGYHKGVRTDRDRLEVCVGAILTQNTSWRNVEAAMAQLRKKKVVELNALARIPEEQLALVIRSSGYFRQKAKKLKLFASHVLKRHGSLKSFLAQDTETLRQELLSLWGVGPETADSIVLYAANRPVFVVDAYTKRIMSRVGVCSRNVSYEGLQDYFHERLPRDAQVFNEYHALLVGLAKNHCKPQPVCASCPLEAFCQKRGVRKVE